MTNWYAVSSGAAKTAKEQPDHWTHGTSTSAAFDRFDFGKNREDSPGQDTYEDDNPKHWNSHLGAHFTSIHDVASNIAREGGGRMIHAKLRMHNPKHYDSEYDLDQEGYQHGVKMGHFPAGHVTSWYAEENLRKHPKIKQIAESFRLHVQDQGHDGITYGNEFEGPNKHKCAIAFHPNAITITHQHRTNEPCDQGDVCQNRTCEAALPKGETYCDHCDTRQQTKSATKKPGLTGYPRPEEYDLHDRPRAQRAPGAPGRPGAPLRGDGSRGAQALPGRPGALDSVVAGRGGTGGDGPLGDLISEPHSVHTKVAKDVKAMDPQVRKKVRQGITNVLEGEQLTVSHTHGLHGAMKGWNSSEVNGAHGYRVIHQPNKTGGIHIGYTGLHEYGDAQQRLASAAIPGMPPDPGTAPIPEGRVRSGNFIDYAEGDAGQAVRGGQVGGTRALGRRLSDQFGDSGGTTSQSRMGSRSEGSAVSGAMGTGERRPTTSGVGPSPHLRAPSVYPAGTLDASGSRRALSATSSSTDPVQGGASRSRELVREPEYGQAAMPPMPEGRRAPETSTGAFSQTDVGGLDSQEPKTATVRHAPKSDEPQTGIMIAIVPPASVVESLVLDEGEEAHELHVTLAYLGDVDEYSEVLLDNLHEVVESWAEDQARFTALVQGVGTFLAASEDEQHVLWASIGSPTLHRLQVSLLDHLIGHGYSPRENHGFTSHLTLAYGKHHFRFLPKVKRQTFKVSEIWVCVAGRWESVSLGRVENKKSA